jgi:hypothetical protein
MSDQDQNHFNSLFNSSLKSGEDEGKPKRTQPRPSDSPFREADESPKIPFYGDVRVQLAFVGTIGLMVAFAIKSAVFPDGPATKSAQRKIDPLPSSITPIQPVQAADINCLAAATVEAKQACEIAKLKAQNGRNNQYKNLPTSPSPGKNNVVNLKQLPVASKPQTIVRVVYKPVERVVYKPVEKVVYKTVPAPQQFPTNSTPYQTARSLSPEETYKRLGDEVVIEGGAPVAQNAAFNQSPNESSPYPVVGDAIGNPNQALTAMNTREAGNLGYSLPVGSFAKAVFEQEISWDVGQSLDIPIFLRLSSPFKTREGKEVGRKGSYLTARISSTNQGCGYTLEVSDIDKATIPSGAIIGTDRAKRQRHDGIGIGQRILSGVLNVGSQYAQRQNTNQGLGVSVGASVAGSLLDAGQSGLTQPQYSGGQPATCKIGEGHKIKLSVNSDI